MIKVNTVLPSTAKSPSGNKLFTYKTLLILVNPFPTVLSTVPLGVVATTFTDKGISIPDPEKSKTILLF